MTSCPSNFHSLVHFIEHSLRKHPEDWSLDQPDSNERSYCLIHKSGLELWMANGFWFFKVYRPYEMLFGAWWKIKLWGLALLRWQQLIKKKPTRREGQAGKILKETSLTENSSL